MLSRRQFLAGAAALGASAVVGCQSGGSKPRLTQKGAPSSTARPPETRPTTTVPEGADMLPQIEHIVVLMMENHSFDNYFGMLGRGDGFTRTAGGKPTNSNPGRNGRPVTAFEMPTPCQLADKPVQSWNASHAQLAGGRMDGFVTSESGPVAMGYWTERTLPFYYGFARTFPVADRYFASCLASTYPNRRFLQAGTADGLIRNIAPAIADKPPPNGTIWDRLNSHGIDWANYYVDLPEIGLFPSVYLANIAHTKPIDAYMAAASSGTLPAVSLVTPRTTVSEEDPQDIQQGEAFAASVINAALTGPGWSKTLLIWTYDEHGGYYDHVAPPAAPVPDAVPPNLQPGDVPGSYDRYGFRVPCVIASPFAKRDYVSSVVHDHTSVLKLIETKWNLPPLTARDAAASNLLDALDLSEKGIGRPAFAEPPELPKSGSATNPSTCLRTGPGPIAAG